MTKPGAPVALRVGAFSRAVPNSRHAASGIGLLTLPGEAMNRVDTLVPQSVREFLAETHEVYAQRSRQ